MGGGGLPPTELLTTVVFTLSAVQGCTPEAGVVKRGSVGVSELESTRKPLVRRWVLLSNGCSTPTLLQVINNTRPQSEPQMSQITLSPPNNNDF